MSFEVASADEGGARVVRVAGEVDLDSSPRLWAELQQALQKGRLVKVQLRDVGYIDSSGVAVLIQGLKHASKSGKVTVAGYLSMDLHPRTLRSILRQAQVEDRR